MTQHNDDSSIHELHLQLGMLQMLDVGLIIVDRHYHIHLWNTFMENHSGLRHSELYQQSLFTRFPALPASWLQRKIESVFTLKNRAFITWEQRPYLFRFNSYRAITGQAPFMYQNITLIPLTSPDGEVRHVGILVYDVTDAAIGKQALESMNQTLQQLSRTDALTGLLNRGFWEAQLALEFDRFARSRTRSTLVMLDIDHFKQINDQYGHPGGDEVLRQLGRLLSKTTRNTDLIGRYGGEEFAILLLDTRPAQAQVMVERLRHQASQLVIQHGQKTIRFTLSLGVSEVHDQFDSYEQWIQLADQALYQSKQNGRNQATYLHLDI